MAIRDVLWKVASRCNLNCTYCYMYNGGDRTWRTQPTFMSGEVANIAVDRVLEYLSKLPNQPIHVGLHGGEPLLAPIATIREWLEALSRVSIAYPGQLVVTVQTNGVNIRDEVLEILREYGVLVYVSYDGLQAQHDRARVDHAGRGSFERVNRFLETLAEHHRDIFGGVLLVSDPSADPERLFESLNRFRPPFVDLLLPLPNVGNTWDEATLGPWLRRLFSLYIERDFSFGVRLFDDILINQAKRRGGEAWIPFDPTSTLVIESNGDYHLDDTLRVVEDGYTAVGLNAFTSVFEDFLTSAKMSELREDLRPPTQCVDCPYYQSCGAGVPAHRWNSDSGRYGPSKYCSSLKNLYEHVWSYVAKEVQLTRSEMIHQ